MGLNFLENKHWWEVTREERFFCAHLYCCVQQRGVADFVRLLSANSKTKLDPDLNWELAYEACFYRDLCHQDDRIAKRYSLKRTFDFCLFSDECIVIIEAKAQQCFNSTQLQSMIEDKIEVPEVTKVPAVLLGAICSSVYDPPDRCLQLFDGPVVSWEALSAHYGGDNILNRANEVFEVPTVAYGANNLGGYMTGAALEQAYQEGQDFYVGRNGGLHGVGLLTDVADGSWKRHRYETNRDVEFEPNRNWFMLSAFMEKVAAQTSNAG